MNSMRKLSVAIFVSVLLAGCASTRISEMSYTEKEQLVEKMGQRCIDQGISASSTKFQECRAYELRREIAARENAPRLEFNPAGAAIAMQGISRGYYNAANQAAPTSTTYTCRRNPSPVGYTSTTCY